VEALISASLVVAALLMMTGLLAKRYLTKTALLSSLSAWCMTGFAVFHGVAHGLEIPAGSALSGFGVGFLVVSASLIAMGLGLGIKMLVERKWLKLDSL
jgi:urease accessory protein